MARRNNMNWRARNYRPAHASKVLLALCLLAGMAAMAGVLYLVAR